MTNGCSTSNPNKILLSSLGINTDQKPFHLWSLTYENNGNKSNNANKSSNSNDKIYIDKIKNKTQQSCTPVFGKYNVERLKIVNKLSLDVREIYAHKDSTLTFNWF